MVHLEMSYLTQSKFPTTMIRDAWFYFGFSLESQTNLVLFHSFAWKPGKLGYIPIFRLKARQTWLYFGLPLESQANLVLSRSSAWKPGKLGYIPVFCLKARQTWLYFGLPLESQANLVSQTFTIFLLTWTYPWLPFFFCPSPPIWVLVWLVLQPRRPIK